MKSLFTGVFALILCVPALPVRAQIVPPSPGVLAQSVERKIATTALHQNASLYQRLAGLFALPHVLPSIPLHSLPPTDIPVTFRVHQAGHPYDTASAFAVQVGDHVYGVTAGHVMRNIADMNKRRYWAEREAEGIHLDLEVPTPQMKIQLPDGSLLSHDIPSWRLSVPSDIAVFEIPPQLLPYIHPLQLSEQGAKVGQVASIPGFANDQPLWLQNEEVLFTTSHRLLLRRTPVERIDGLCGSPVLINDQVAGLYIGGFLHASLREDLFSQPLPNAHRVVPIENIFPLINDLTGNTTLPTTMMKVLGHPIAELRPQDNITSIVLIRDGKEKKCLFPGDLTDPEHLEDFLTLQENDILRIVIWPISFTAQTEKIFQYDVNVTTGQVTKSTPF
ncbi:MAG: hypothetical protein MJ053_01165 [Elusimicrobiaceae bacterium]|nr:hypothetical protein [Elusimicrobiaceae bacterium]